MVLVGYTVEATDGAIGEIDRRTGNRRCSFILKRNAS